MGRRQRIARQHIAWNITDIAVAHELDPGPAIGFVIDGDSFAKQRLGFKAARRVRMFAQRDRTAHDLSVRARNIALGFDDAFQRFGGEVTAIGMAARIWLHSACATSCGRAVRRGGGRSCGNVPGHVFNSRLKTSMTARAVCGSPPLGPSGRADVRQP